jgi:multisubunit Na+/H+ antiporter MnhF subunit
MTPLTLLLWALAIAGAIIIVGLALLLVIAAVIQLKSPTQPTNVVQLDTYRKKPTPLD